MMEMLITIGMSILTALGIALTMYASKSKLIDPNQGQAFEGRKMVRTLVVGVIIGIVAYFQGFEITEANFEMYSTTNALVIVGADLATKFIWKLLVNRVIPAMRGW